MNWEAACQLARISSFLNSPTTNPKQQVLMNWKAAWSMLVGAVLMFGVVAPAVDAINCYSDTGEPCGDGFGGLKAYWFLPPLTMTVVDSLYQFARLVVMYVYAAVRVTSSTLLLSAHIQLINISPTLPCGAPLST
jgi:hypothetical protein